MLKEIPAGVILFNSRVRELRSGVFVLAIQTV
jgi:hypothetical protein